MRKIIDGITYDIEKAIEIGSHDNGNPDSGDFTHWSATLYRDNRTGHFFLYGKGGTMTRFAQWGSDGLRCGGEMIIPMEPEEALGWAGQYLDAETLERHFGVVKEQ